MLKSYTRKKNSIFSGVLLSGGGFLSFMLTGSIPAIRFGIILGGTLLALSVSSLRSWKNGEPAPLLLKGQTGLSLLYFDDLIIEWLSME